MRMWPDNHTSKPIKTLKQQRKAISLSGGVWAIFALLLGYCIFSQYPLLVFYGALILIYIITSLWKLYQPSVLLFWFLYQWIQVMAAIWYTDTYGLPFSRTFRTSHGETAVLLGFTGILLQVFFIQLVLRKQGAYALDYLKSAAAKFNINRLITLYIISAILYPIIFRIAINTSELTQFLLIFAKLKQIFTILLVFLLFLRGEKKSLIILILCYEFLSGFLTYFSTFKDVIIISLICYLSFIRKLKVTTILKLLPLVAVLFVVMVFWTAVKGQYRMFVNEGTRTQQVQVESSDAFKKLFELATTFNTVQFQVGLNHLVFRIQYLLFFSKVMDRVPAVMPHENGDLLLSSLRFVIVPRFLDPDKGLHDASVKTSKYTGLRIAGLSKGTSMAIGYFGDAYIDFGAIGMMIPIVFIAILIGLYYRYLMSRKFNILLVYSITTAFIMNLGFFESDTVIVLGFLKNGFLVNVLFVFTLYPWLNRFLTSGDRKKPSLHSNLQLETRS